MIDTPGRYRELDQSDALQGLTSQMQLFVTHVFSGMNYTEAYRAAGYGEGLSPDRIGVRAHELAHHPKVQGKLAELRQKRDDATTLAPLLSRQWITEGIMSIATKGDKDSTRLAAYIALGKVVGIDLFRETVTHETKTRTIDEIDAELRARLKDLQPVIDGTSRSVDATPALQPGDRRRKPKA